MDRPLAETYRNREKLKKLVYGLIGLALLAFAVWGLRSKLQTKVDSNRIRTAKVKLGAMEQTISASGVAKPDFELTITSPLKATVSNVFQREGSTVDAGQPLLLLDKTFALLELERRKDQLQLKQNSIQRSKLELQKNIRELEIKNKIKALELKSLKATLDDAVHLQKIGGGSKEEVKRAEVNLAVAKLEKQSIENDLEYQQQDIESKLLDLELEAQIESNRLQELEAKLKQADIVADRRGVVTWINQNLGSAINEGDVLAKVADLSSFYLEGSVSDRYSDRLNLGMSVVARVNNKELQGTISQILPTVENNILRFIVRLEKQYNEVLLPNMKVEIYIVTGRKEKTKRIANGPAFKGGKVQEVFVMDPAGKIAYKRKVKVGMTNIDHVELLDNIEEGEEVIISDTRSFVHLSQISLNHE